MRNIYFLLLSVSMVPSCLPPIYVYSQQTVMELESSAEWPDFEKELREESMSYGPTPLREAPLREKDEIAFSVLNAEFTSNTVIDTKQPKETKNAELRD